MVAPKQNVKAHIAAAHQRSDFFEPLTTPNETQDQLPRPSSEDDTAGVRERQRIALGKPGTWIGIEGARMAAS
jgi:hypothetical protein